jgi:hypothetical protein
MAKNNTDLNITFKFNLTDFISFYFYFCSFAGESSFFLTTFFSWIVVSISSYKNNLFWRQNRIEWERLISLDGSFCCQFGCQQNDCSFGFPGILKLVLNLDRNFNQKSSTNNHPKLKIKTNLMTNIFERIF